MSWKYKKNDIVMMNNIRYCIILECIEDSNNYHYYEIDSLTTKPFLTKNIDKILLEDNTDLDKRIDRQRKIKRIFK